VVVLSVDLENELLFRVVLRVARVGGRVNRLLRIVDRHLLVPAKRQGNRLAAHVAIVDEAVEEDSGAHFRREDESRSELEERERNAHRDHAEQEPPTPRAAAV